MAQRSLSPEELDAISHPRDLSYEPFRDDVPFDYESQDHRQARGELGYLDELAEERYFSKAAGEVPDHILDELSEYDRGLRDLSEIDRSAPEPLLLGRLDPTGHTVLFGPGGVGKGVLSAYWAVQLQRAGKGVLILDYENHPEEWARRHYGLGGIQSVGSGQSAPGVLHYAPLTQPDTAKAIWDNVEFIDGLLDAYAIDLIIVDSIVMACGGADPMDPGVAARYGGAIQGFHSLRGNAAGELVNARIPVLSLAHVTKADDLRFPFGSVFFHNLARVTWSLERSGESTILTNRKANNYEAPGKTLVTVTWTDDLPREVWEQPYSKVLSDRIADVLGVGEGLTVAQITTRLADEVDEDGSPPKANSVRTALRRGLRSTPKRFEITGSGATATWIGVSS